VLPGVSVSIDTRLRLREDLARFFERDWAKAIHLKDPAMLGAAVAAILLALPALVVMAFALSVYLADRTETQRVEREWAEAIKRTKES
jgi:hypothetical protein